MKTKLLALAATLNIFTACQNNNLQNISDSADISAGIVGGQKVAEDSTYTKMALLLINRENNKICTGAILKSKVVLTAAHCIPENKENLGIFEGSEPLVSSRDQFTAVDTWKHNQYSATKSENDLGFVLLDKEVDKFNAIQELIQIQADRALKNKAQMASKLSEKNFLSLGYGQIKERTASKVQLRSVEFKTNENNQLILNREFVRSSSQGDLFKVNQMRGKGICFGDSGGPLFQFKNEKWELFAIATEVKAKSQVDGCRGEGVWTTLDSRQSEIKVVLTLWGIDSL